MNGFVVYHDVIKLIEPYLKNETTSLLTDIHRAKVLARTIKAQRYPAWPTLPSTDLPPKQVCDLLLDGYIRTVESLYRILHIPTFLEDYEAVFSGDRQPSTSFMMQMKLVLAIGAVMFDDKYTMRTTATRWIFEVQNWLSTPVFKSQLGVQYIQTSIILLLGRELGDVGSEFVWISAGALLRTAIYIGLHKDPAQLPRMALVEQETRRRLWNTLLEINLQSSLTSGGPCLISLKDFNTEPPGNYDDEQLTTDHPVAKPANVFTQSSAAIAMRKTFPVRLKVIKFLNDFRTSGTYEETLQIDTQLRSAYKSMRRELLEVKGASLPTPFTMEAIEFIMHCYISALHVPFFNPALHEAEYAYSRKAVVESSIKIWTLANPSASLPSQTASMSLGEASSSPSQPTESDLARLCRCGSGFFRAFPFHGALFLTADLRTQLQEEDSVPRPDLVNICESAASHHLRCIETGETSTKGYLFMAIVAAQIDCIKRRVCEEEMAIETVRAAEKAVAECLPLLEAAAREGHEGMAGGGEGGGGAVDDNFDFGISPDFTQDWDMVMSDMFQFGDGNGFQFEELANR